MSTAAQTSMIPGRAWCRQSLSPGGCESARSRVSAAASTTASDGAPPPGEAAAAFAAAGDPATAAATPPEKIWLTTFEDLTWPGGTEDLYFTASEDRSEVRPPPIIRDRTREVWIPTDVVLGLGVFAFFIIRRRRTQP